MHRSEPTPAAEAALPARAETRIDPPHLVHTARDADIAPDPAGRLPAGSTATAAADVRLATPAGTAAQFVQQVQTQAAQLAERLQLQQKELDQREAELNARLAAVENQVRSARLWAEQQHEALNDREAQVATQEQLVGQRLAELGIVVDDHSITAVESALVERASELARREAQVAADHAALDQTRKQFEQQATQLDVRRRYLDKTESLLSNEQQSLGEVRRQCDADLAQLQQQRVHLRDQYATRQARMEAEYRRRYRDLEQRSTDLEKREIALEKLRDALSESQREVLEIRLATEELCSELSVRTSPSVLERSITRIRARLADHYSLARTELEQRHEELEQIGRRVFEQHQKLQQQKEDLTLWVRRREGDLDQQAARIVARERELDRRKSRCEEQRLQWQEERVNYQREIRQLFAKLHPREDRVG